MSTSPNSDTQHPTVIVIGGGATGVGIARDAALRGFKVILIERGSLGNGTSGHFHGILHSGVRYVVNDPKVAQECFEENQILRRIVPTAITDTGGLFVAMNDQEAAHADTVIQACVNAGIPCQEITAEQALQAEPNLSPSVQRAFTVPDAFIDGEELLRLNRQAALSANVPATFLTHHEVVELHKEAHTITTVTLRDLKTGSTEQIHCDYIVNAAGVWAGQVAQLASIPLDMIFDKGTMIDFKDRFANAVLNRCRPEADGDLLVPHGTYSVMGTTARPITDVNASYPTQEEVDLLLREGAEMIPKIKGAEVTRIYAGVRPLFGKGAPQLSSDTRSISRSYSVLDHTEHGVSNMVSVVGGKVTLYRRMAESTVDLLCIKSGCEQKCSTADKVILA